MKLHIFGTLGGAEPFAGRQHTSFAVDTHNGLYWFDAGEGCSRTAHLMGLDLRRVQKICISHTHMDHVGGLENLFWNIRKLNRLDNQVLDHDLELFIPDPDVWAHVLGVLQGSDATFPDTYAVHTQICRDGILFEDRGVRVDAMHTKHLAPFPDGRWRSFAYSIREGGKKVVFSGDSASVEELYPLMEDCDVLLMETGHHQPEAVARTLIRDGMLPAHIAFLHHGRAILEDREGQETALRGLLGEAFTILEDGMTFDL